MSSAPPIHVRGHGIAAAAVAADLARDHQVWWQPVPVPARVPALLLGPTWATTRAGLARFAAWTHEQQLPPPTPLAVDAPDAPAAAVAGLLDGALLLQTLTAQAQARGARAGRAPAAPLVVWVRGPHQQPLQPHRDPQLPAAMLRVVRGATASDDQYLFRFHDDSWRLTARPVAAHVAHAHGVGRATGEDQCRTTHAPQQLVAVCPGSASLLALPSVVLQVRALLRALPLMSS